MVVVAQLAELLAVAEKVGGSSPLDHPFGKLRVNPNKKTA